MNHRLILVRHAKSSWGNESLGDHARPLNGRGRRAATAIGTWLKDQAYLPDIVLSSDAARTRETWQLIAEELPTQPEVQFEKQLYLAPPHMLLEHAQGVDAHATVLLLAHNPGIAEAAAMFAKEIPDHVDFSRYPTGATTVFDVDINDWSSLSWATALVREFVVPREI